jgi:hypothetical protein
MGIKAGGRGIISPALLLIVLTFFTFLTIIGFAMFQLAHSQVAGSLPQQ